MALTFETTLVADGSGDSTLTLTWDDFSARIADLLDVASTANVVAIIVNDGYRQFLYPAQIPNEKIVHVWSFLNPNATLNTITEYSTGTVAVTDDSTTVTLTTGTWPSWVASDATLVIADTSYGVASRTDGADIELDEAWSAGTDAAAAYSIHYHPEDYELNAQFGGLRGEITYDDASRFQPVPVISEGQIMTLRARDTTRTGKPQFVAVRSAGIPSGTSAGQRHDLLIWPEPDDDYLLNIPFNVQVNKLSATNTYPVGGSQHSDTILASMRDVWERSTGNTSGVEHANFMERLAASIQNDRQTMAPKTLGYGAGQGTSGGHYERPSAYTTHLGVQYP